jgi:hypothetical protein
MTTAKISFAISPSDPACPLGVEVWIDQQQIFNTEHLADTVNVSHDIDEDDAEHQLRVVLKHKKTEHTIMDTDGNITRDAVINVGAFEIDGIDVEQLVQHLAVYTHNFNGSAAEIQDQFFDIMGCNGTLSLKFSTPIYIWLLENM